MNEKNVFTTISSSKRDRSYGSIKIIIVALIFIIFVLLGLLVWALSLRDTVCSSGDYSSADKIRLLTNKSKLCLTKECISIASTMLDKLNPSIDPCDDFYDYACGNYVNKHAVPEEYFVKNMLQDIHEGTFLDMRNYLQESIHPTDEPQIVEIKHLYQSCMEEMPNQTLNAVDSLLKLIHETTGRKWLLVSDEDKNDDIDEILSLLSRERQIAMLFLHQVQPFFQIVVAPDRHRTSYAIHILPGSTVLEQLNFNLTKENDEALDQYRHFQHEALKIFDVILDNRKRMKRREEILDLMMEFELDLYNITKDLTFDHCIKLSSDVNKSENEFVGLDLCDEKHINPNLFINITLEEMNKQFPEIDWHKMFDFILNETSVDLQYVLIHSREYFRSLIRVLGRYSNDVIETYFGWSIAVKYMPYLGSPFKLLMSEFHQKNPVLDPEMNDSGTGFKYYHSKWKQCVSIVCEGLKIPSISLYVKKNTKRLEDLEKSISSLIKQMKSTFVEMIEQQTWIESSKTKDSYQKRISTIRSNIGVPEHCQNQTWIEMNYKSLKIDPHVELVSNIFQINIHETRMEMKKVHKPISRDNEMVFQPLDANAFYDFSSNEIIIPVGIMRPPLLYENIPKYLQMSFFGMIIGHEIAHSIEINSKKLLTSTPPEHSHLSNKSDKKDSKSVQDNFNERYRQKATCFTKQFSDFKLHDINDNINGNQTLEENLCDFASFQQAYSIYKKIPVNENDRLPGFDNLTTDQLFMIHFGQLWCEVTTKEGHQKSLLDPHAPGKYRANGVIMNSRAFAEVFNCPEGSAMNPKNKCDLWSMNY